MEPEAMIIIDQLGKIISQNTSQIVTYYTKWHVLSAYAWAFFGGFIMAASFKAPTPESFEENVAIVLRSAVFIAGLIFVVGNSANIFAPEAYAIHQLILDIRGK